MSLSLEWSRAAQPAANRTKVKGIYIMAESRWRIKLPELVFLNFLFLGHCVCWPLAGSVCGAKIQLVLELIRLRTLSLKKD